MDVLTTHDGNILLKNINGTIYHINHLTFVTDTIRPPDIKTEGVEVKDPTVWYDERRNLIYLTGTGGIAQYNLENKKTKSIPHVSLFGNLPPNQGVCASTLDAAGRIWFLIPKYGFRIIKRETLVCNDSIPFGTRGLMRGDYTNLIGGHQNYMLFRSQNGIVVYDFVKQQSFLFDHSNGLSSPENKSFLYCNGNMIIGQSGSFEYFKLRNIEKISLSVKSYLNTILADTSTVFIRTGNNDSATIRLPHYQNTLTFTFSAPEFFFPERIEYAYKLEGVDKIWQYTNYFNRKIIYSKLLPGEYKFLLKAQMQGGNWSIEPVEYKIIIVPAFWQTKWFKLLCILAVISLIIYFVQQRIKSIRKKEQQKSKYEKELLELEAKSLRAQMNPHFIFNCLNSIKSLIQQHEEEKSVNYLTTFSKLIRTLFSNVDKKEISLYDEIETCKLYLQLEAMRFDTKFSYRVNVDDNLDLKSMQVPALIIQPFIENAIWHGIVPKGETGHVELAVIKKGNSVEIVIDDNGIGREASKQNKSASSLMHESRGVNLTKSRLELDNLLRQRQAKLETTDKKDEKGLASGTKVTITINEELS